MCGFGAHARSSRSGSAKTAPEARVREPVRDRDGDAGPQVAIRGRQVGDRGGYPLSGSYLLACSLDVAGQEPATIVSARPSATQSRSASGSSTAAVSLLIPMSMDPR